MSQELTAIPSNVTTHGGEMQVSAFTPDEMLHANAALIQWCSGKIAAVTAEASELRQAYEHAKERKWKSETLRKHASLAERRVIFFEKMKLALEQGFYVVPNFPVEVFAIRTTKDSPAMLMTTEITSWKPNHSKTQFAQALPTGDGEYKNPFPLVETYETGRKSDKGTPEWKSYAEEWADIEFPLTMAKPQIMQAASRAMTLKLFDEIGILQDRKSGDPLIIGRIIDPRPTGSQFFRKHLSFIIAWHLDTKTL
jgi:hypothetical protein